LQINVLNIYAGKLREITLTRLRHASQVSNVTVGKTHSRVMTPLEVVVSVLPACGPGAPIDPSRRQGLTSRHVADSDI